MTSANHNARGAHQGCESDESKQVGLSLDRRAFVKTAAGVAACGIALEVSGNAIAQDAKPNQSEKPQPEKPQPKKPDPPSPLPNSLAPAIGFQAAPSGSGAFLDGILAVHRGSPIHRQEIQLEACAAACPQTDEQIAFLPVHRQAALIRSCWLTPTRLVDIYLKRLKRLDPKLLCAVTMMEESAREQARQAEVEIRQGKYRGPLHGIPWGVKDLFSTRGYPTTWGVKPFEHRIIDEDAEIVVRLRQAGAILIAKLATGVLAMGDRWFRGRTRNPWNPQQGSSGSSAGPASATAAGCVGFAIGTETRGSIVSPAKRCGLSALRPTFGRVSRHGGMTLSWSMDKAGPMARTIEDCALVFNVIHGADDKDPSTVTAPFCFERTPNLAKLRIGFDPSTDEQFLNKLRDLGAEPQEIPRRPDSRGVTGILNVESAAAFDDFIAKHLDEEMVNKWRVDRFRSARNTTALDYLNAQRRRFALMRDMDEFMQGIDLYVSPSGDVGLTNLTGHPAVVVPYTFQNGQPNCITLIGKLFGDDVLLSVAHRYQAATEWHIQHPQLS